MAFPNSPTNGQSTTVDGINYTYSSSENSWTRQTLVVSTDTTASSNTVILQGVDVTQNTRITVLEGVNTTQNTNITTVTGLAQAAFDKANTGVSTSTDDYARTTSNTATNNIVILQGVNTTQNTRISSVDNTATAAYAKANAAFDKANTGVTSSIDDYARVTSNTATNNIVILQGVNATQNTNITNATSLAQAAYNQANTGGLVSNTGNITVSTFTGDGTTVAFNLPVTPTNKDYTFITFDGATQLKASYSLSGNLITFSEAPLVGENIEIISFTNGVITSYDTLARDIANTATNNITILQGVNTTQNTRLSVVEGGLISANANTVYLNSLITTNNTRISVIEGGLISANANSAYLQGALNTANTNINTKFNSSGGTISGSVTISGNNDLIVTGNLIITGNISSQNVQQLAVADPLLVLGLGNYVSDTKDIGFAGHYNDGANAHTGLIRDSGTKEYHFFTGYTPEVDVTNNIDINHASFVSANVNASTFKGNLIATTAVVGGVNLLNVNTSQNTRMSVIEGGLISSNANTVFLNSLITTNNTRIAVVEGGLISANANTIYLNSLITTNNTRISSVDNTATAAYAKANAAFDKANTGVSTSTDDYARTTANTATNNITILQGVNATQNTNITYGTNLAQAAYNQANTGGLVSNTGIITVDTFVGNGSNVAFTLSVTPVTKNYTFITFDGATQLKDSYSLSGNIITFTEAPLNGENIEIISFTNGVITSFDTVARDLANTATNNITILQGVNVTQNTRITSADNTATAAYAKANAAFDKANTGVSTSTDDYARTTANTATNNITILQGVNTTQNTNITNATSLAQSAFDAANTLNGTFTIQYLVVAGGGPGGTQTGGGGGAGGVLSSYLQSEGATYTVTVGSGAAGRTTYGNGSPGANSSFVGSTNSIVAVGGGYGSTTSTGGNGGSGGGTGSGGGLVGGTGIAGQGNNGGGTDGTGINYPSGGGGGAGATGGVASGYVAGSGGAGRANPISTSTIGQLSGGIYYVGGGGGGGIYGSGTAGSGGLGGGGAGSSSASTPASGSVNTGGGGGGSGLNAISGAGGSGVVILRTLALADSTTGSPTVTYDGAYNIYTFTSSGSIVFPATAEAPEIVDITARADVVTLQSVNTTQNTRIAVIEGVNTTQNTRMSVIEGGLITANANSAYLTSINTTQNTNITYATSLAQAAFDKANTGTSGGSSNVTIVTSDSFVGNGSNVAFTLSVTPSSKDYTIITFDGAVQLRSSYSLAANTITFTEAPLNGENVEVTSFSSSSTLATVTINTFTGDGSTVAYTLSVSPSSKDYTFVNFDGTAQLRSSYSLSGNILTFTEAPLVGENIEVTSFTTNSTSSGTTIGKAIAMSIIFGG